MELDERWVIGIRIEFEMECSMRTGMETWALVLNLVQDFIDQILLGLQSHFNLTDSRYALTFYCPRLPVE